MAKIRSGNTTKGRPGFKTSAIAARFTGSKVGKSSVGRRGVRRLFARDPANGLTANIGTKADASFVQPDVNTNGTPNPRIVKAPKNVSDKGIKVRDKSTNRRVRRTNS